MKKLGFILIAVMISLTAASQNRFTLSGYVTDEQGEAITGVYVIVPNSSYGTITNVYGFYSLTLPAGNYVIRYSFIGFETKEQQFSLTVNTKSTVSLKPESSAIDAVTITAQRKDENVKRHYNE